MPKAFISLPADLEDARSFKSPTGKSLFSSKEIISWPTAPVAPTIPIRYFFQMDRVECYKFCVDYIEKLNLVPTDTLLVVSIKKQVMFLYNAGQCVKAYVISHQNALSCKKILWEPLGGFMKSPK